MAAISILGYKNDTEALRQQAWREITAGIREIPILRHQPFLTCIVSNLIEDSTSQVVLERVLTSISDARQAIKNRN